ncbi:hypothetical protein M407DRAFT_9263 [Tulasnella calospora MUT 4182]|uniref:Uncharacterized protein n=1 Tax=Tulasnella calospora MUT 4182 TaxID=1051891 RepID=A0A0C3QDQ1_9AGAM|nr:hypothetical protein M407DRAFT_9263 [Tulasnella calospora MUT 4182]
MTRLRSATRGSNWGSMAVVGACLSSQAFSTFQCRLRLTQRFGFGSLDSEPLFSLASLSPSNMKGTLELAQRHGTTSGSFQVPSVTVLYTRRRKNTTIRAAATPTSGSNGIETVEHVMPNASCRWSSTYLPLLFSDSLHCGTWGWGLINRMFGSTDGIQGLILLGFL